MRAIIYSRVSTDAQERDGTSLDTQERACLELAADRGWRVARCLRDSDSGALLERSGLNELREALRRGEADVVVSYAVDRLSRSQNHIGILFDEFEQVDVRMEFVTERFEDTAVGRFILAARAFIAEVEREKIAERTMRGKAERARSGRIPQATGRGIYGYRYDPATGRRVIDQEQAAVVHRIFEDFVAGGSIAGLTNALNGDAIPTYTGGAWSSWTIRNMLLNPAYAGRTVYRRTKATYRRDPRTGRRRRVVEVRDPSDWIEVPDATPAIVPEDLFEAAQRRLQDPERRRAAQRKYDYGLTGIVRCGCGSAMVGQTTSGKYRYYRCRRAFAGPRHDRCPTRYVRADDLEDAVVRELTTVLSHPELVLAELEHASSAGAIEHGEVERMRERLAALEKQHQRLLRLYQLGEVDDAYLQREAAAIRAQRVRVEATLERTNGADRPRIRLPQSPEEFAATCALLRERLLAEVDEGRLEQVAQAFQLSAELTSTEEGVSGALEGVIPHRFGENISHHCTNIGMTLRPWGGCRSRCRCGSDRSSAERAPLRPPGASTVRWGSPSPSRPMMLFGDISVLRTYLGTT